MTALQKIEYNPTKHKVTYGMYGTFEERFPTTEVGNRALRKIARFLEPLAGNAMPERPVFIIGAGRSGTSILARALAHRDIAQYPGEALDLWFPGNFPWIHSRLDKPPFWFAPGEYASRCLAEWTARDTARIRRIFALFQKMQFAPVFLNKNAMSCCSLEHIEATFPGATYIYMVRDGRPTAVSHAEQQFARKQASMEAHQKSGYDLPFGAMLEAIAQGWSEQILALEKSIEKLGLREQNRLLEIRYEDFCRTPQEHVAAAFRFIGVAPERGLFADFASIKPTNARLNDLLPGEALAELNEIMREGLNLKGYLA